MWPVVLLVVAVDSIAADSGANCRCEQRPAASKPDQEVEGTELVANSKNFIVESHSGRFDARKVATRCEQWREYLQAKWLGDKQHDGWNPRCVVVVHGRRENYCAAIGRGNDWSFGSSWIDTRGKQVVQRRIDLLADDAGAISAFAHELTHVVLADAFLGTQPPLWANEGIAVLADSAEKQRLHQQDLQQSLVRGNCFHCAELTLLEGYPSQERIPVFYGQSASLTAYLADLSGSEKLVPFLKQAMDRGYDRALRECFGIEGLADLQRRWHEHHTTKDVAAIGG